MEEIHGLPNRSSSIRRHDGFVSVNVNVNQVRWQISLRCPWTIRRPVLLFFHFWGGLFGFFGEHESPPPDVPF